jgi:hypothetical protein
MGTTEKKKRENDAASFLSQRYEKNIRVDKNVRNHDSINTRFIR